MASPFQGSRKMRGRRLKQVSLFDEHWLALPGWGGWPRCIADRDGWIG